MRRWCTDTLIKGRTRVGTIRLLRFWWARPLRWHLDVSLRKVVLVVNSPKAHLASVSGNGTDIHSYDIWHDGRLHLVELEDDHQAWLQEDEGTEGEFHDQFSLNLTEWFDQWNCWRLNTSGNRFEILAFLVFLHYIYTYCMHLFIYVFILCQYCSTCRSQSGQCFCSFFCLVKYFQIFHSIRLSHITA